MVQRVPAGGASLDRLHGSGIQSSLSCAPRFVPSSCRRTLRLVLSLGLGFVVDPEQQTVVHDLETFQNLTRNMRASKPHILLYKLQLLLTVHPSICSPVPHQTVSLQGFHQSAVCVLVHGEAFRNVIQKVQVFESGLGFLSFLLGRSPLVRGALQIKLEVHAHGAWQDIVHHNHSDVFAPALDAVQAKKLWQQSAGVLVQVLERRSTPRPHGKRREEFNREGLCHPSTSCRQLLCVSTCCMLNVSVL